MIYLNSYLHRWPFFPNLKLDTEIRSLYENINCKWSNFLIKNFTLFFLFVQVSALSASSIFRLRPFVWVRSPTPTIPTSLSVSVGVALSKFSLTKSSSRMRFARLRMTKRLFSSFWIQFGMPYLPFSQSGSLSVSDKSTYISAHSDPNVNTSTYRYVNSCHKYYQIFTHHFLEILAHLQSWFPRFACINLVSLHADCHPSPHARVDSDSRTLKVRVKSICPRKLSNHWSCRFS